MIDPSRRDHQRGDLAKARHTSGWGHVPSRQPRGSRGSLTFMSDFDVDELRRLERQCLEQAQECARPEGRTALLSLAVDYIIALASSGSSSTAAPAQ